MGKNNVDAAIAKATSPSLLVDHIYQLESTGSSVLLSSICITPKIGDMVTKSGRTTGVTQGVVIATDASLSLIYGQQNVSYDDLTVVQGVSTQLFSTAGDSGAAVISSNGGFVGLLFAGDNETNTTYICKSVNILSLIESEVGISFYVTTHLPVIISEPKIPSVPYTAPLNLSPGTATTDPGTLIDTTNPTLSWAAIPGYAADNNNGYLVLLYTLNSLGMWEIFFVCTTASTSLQIAPANGIDSLAPNTAYGWQVSGYNDNKVTGPYSLPCYFRTPPAITPLYSVTIYCIGALGGSVTPASPLYCPVGTMITLIAQPFSGYTFAFWNGKTNSGPGEVANDITSQNNPYYINIMSNTTLYPTFRQNSPEPGQISYTLFLGTSPAAGGNTRPNYAVSYISGTYVGMYAEALPSFVFKCWRVYGPNFPSGPYIEYANQYTVIEITSAMTAIAVFVSLVEFGQTPTLPTAPSHTLTMAVSPPNAGITSPAVGVPTNCVAGAPITISATPSAGYTFSNWCAVGDTGETTTTTNNPATIQLGANCTITAIFTGAAPPPVNNQPIPIQLAPQPPPVYTLTTSVSGNGIITPTPGSYPYTLGNLFTLSAMPDSGSVFSYWQDSNGNVYYTQSLTIQFTASITYTAFFVPFTTPDSHILTVNIVGNGSVNSKSGQYPTGTLVTLTAVPLLGYTFKSWSGGATGSNASIDITMNSDLTITATFIQTGGQSSYALSVTKMSTDT